MKKNKKTLQEVLEILIEKNLDLKPNDTIMRFIEEYECKLLQTIDNKYTCR